jgi:hypothetical protein
MTMLKYLFVPVLAFTLLSCQSDQNEPITEQSPSEDPMQEQFQPQQPAAEIDVSDDELRQFLDASSVVQQIQMESQQEMVAIVEDEGLAVETFNQIAQARQAGQTDNDLNVSSDDIEKFEQASETINELEQDMESKLMSAIEDEGMQPERFMAINMALQQDPSLQQRIQEMMGQPQMQQ